MSSRIFPRLLAVLLMALPCAWIQAQVMPEFGPNVKFAPGEPGPVLADLHGKVVVLVFFQSWCPICNGWSPDMLQQVQKAYAGIPGYVLVALKTDSGDYSSAVDYLKGHGVDPALWVVGSDQDAVYYKSVTGQDGLWHYAIVDPTGNCTKTGQAGMYYPAGAGKTFVLATERKHLDESFGSTLVSVLPTDHAYDQAVLHGVRLAETGRLVPALAWVRTNHALIGAPVLDKDIIGILKQRMDDFIAKAQDKDNIDRFGAYIGLRDLLAKLPGLPEAKSQRKILGDIAKDKDLAKDMRAEHSWESLMDQANGLPHDQRGPALRQALPPFIQKNQGTYCARQADQLLADLK